MHMRKWFVPPAHSRVLLEKTAGLQSEGEEEEQEFIYLPIACRKVLEWSCRALQSGWVGALCQECQVWLHHRRVPEHLHPFRRLGKSWNRADSIPLRKECRFVTGQNLYIVMQVGLFLSSYVLSHCEPNLICSIWKIQTWSSCKVFFFFFFFFPQQLGSESLLGDSFPNKSSSSLIPSSRAWGTSSSKR